jgi:hypothetical protein
VKETDLKLKDGLNLFAEPNFETDGKIEEIQGEDFGIFSN